MNIDRVKEHKKQLLAAGMLAVAAVLIVLTAAKVAAFYMDSARAQSLAKDASTSPLGGDAYMEEHLSESTALANELKKKNLFAPPPPKQHPVKSVQGILGDEVLINGKLYGAGDKIGDATVVSVHSTKVVIEWDGKTKDFAPMAAASEPQPERPSNTGSRVSQPQQAPTQMSRGQTQTAVAPTRSSAEDPLAWLGVELSPELRAKFIEKWNQMPDEQKAEAKAEWGRMSDEEKQKVMEQWKQM